MTDDSAHATELEKRIQEFSHLVKKIEQRIEVEQAHAQPDTELVRRLEQESIDLKDTLKRAQQLADQENPSDTPAT